MIRDQMNALHAGLAAARHGGMVTAIVVGVVTLILLLGAAAWNAYKAPPVPSRLGRILRQQMEWEIARAEAATADQVNAEFERICEDYGV